MSAISRCSANITAQAVDVFCLHVLKLSFHLLADASSIACRFVYVDRVVSSFGFQALFPNVQPVIILKHCPSNYRVWLKKTTEHLRHNSVSSGRDTSTYHSEYDVGVLSTT
jgi:hypothetical protein